MMSYYYCCEVNLDHHAAPDVKGSNDDVRAVSFISRSFMDKESAFYSIEQDIINKLDGFMKDGNVPIRVSETNPLNRHSYEELEEKAKDDQDLASYLTTWDTDLVGRMSVIDENVESDEELEETTFSDMPPKDYILRYYIRRYDDGIEISEDAMSLITINDFVH